jgi:hypothetical protein
MAVNKVTADVNGESYRLAKVGQDSYSRSITAPSEADDYSVLVRVSDDAGNVTEVNSQLKVNIDPNSADLRQSILTDELGDIMLDTVAPLYDNSKLTLYVFQSFGITLAKEMDFTNGDFISQIFPQTATWGLVAWEDEFGITPDASKTIEQRRQYLMSVMFKHSPMTPYRIKQLVEGITGFKCEIVENYRQNTMRISIRGYYTNVTAIRTELDKRLPAHMNYIIVTAEKTDIDVDRASAFSVSMKERFELEV